MKLKLFKRLSLGLCFSMMVFVQVYAAPVQKQIFEEDTSGHNVEIPEEIEFLDYVVNEDTYEISDIYFSEDSEQQTFLDYFPDPHFAQSVAENLGKSKEDTITLQQLSVLSRLDAENDISSIKGIEYLTNLRYIYLEGNHITEIPEGIGQLTNLQILSLPHNQIFEIPEIIGQLTNLQFLILNNNQISEIPDSISQLTNLQSLNLARNQISEIPESLGQLTNLQNFTLVYNQITSPLPATLLTNGKGVYIQYQSGFLTPLYLSDSADIFYEKLTSPLILQAKENNNGILGGVWNITGPERITFSVIGGDGSEITPSLFEKPGKYVVSFQWTAIEPYPNMNLYPGSGLNFSSKIEIEVGRAAKDAHTVTVLTRYLDDALPESTATYQVEHNSTFLEPFQVIEGYELYNSTLRSLPIFNVDMDTKTIGLNAVDRDYTVILEFGKTEYKINLNTSYSDDCLPTTTQTEWIPYEDGYIRTYEIAEGYQIANLDQIPDGIIVDEANHTVAIDSVTQDFDIYLKFEKKYYDVAIRIVYEDGYREDLISTYTVSFGDSFAAEFDIEKGYSIKKISFNAIGVSVNRIRKEVTIDKVTSSA